MSSHRFLIVAVVGVFSSVHADTIYVDDDNCPGPGDGSELNPYCSIQTAIDNAVDTDEIVVAPGTYFETIDFMGKTVWLHSSDGPDVTIIDATGLEELSVVTCMSGEGADTLLAGFTITGGSGTELGCDPLCFLGGGGMYNSDSNPTVINCTFSGNSAHTGGGMYNSNSNPTVTNCRFFGNVISAFAGSGGGMSNVDSSPAVTDCLFVGNWAIPAAFGTGGGMSNWQSSPTVTNCTFDDNNAADGGGMSIGSGSGPTVTNCTFQGNTADNGGGMSNGYNSNPTVTGCSFIGNSAEGGSYPYGRGGAMYNENSSPTVTDCEFTDNSAFVCNPGGCHGAGGAIFSLAGTPVIVGCEFESNGAASGGGIHSEGGSPTVSGCGFDGNFGGGVIGYGAGNSLIAECVFRENLGVGVSLYAIETATVTRCIFVRNRPSGPCDGGGLSIEGGNILVADCQFLANDRYHGGGFRNGGVTGAVINCLFVANSGGALANEFAPSPSVINCTFVANVHLSDSAAISNYPGGCGQQPLGAADPGNPLVRNCILWHNGPNPVSDCCSTVIHSDVEGGWPGFGNIDVAPEFVRDPTAGPDGQWGTGDDDYGDLRLMPGSPCIDAGHNNAIAGLTDTDLDGNPRFADDPATDDTGCGVPVVVDMGAYEYQGDTADVTFGDLDGDGAVRIADLLLLMGCLGSAGPECCTADFDMDGEVGMSDRWVLLSKLIQSIPDP